METSLLTSPEVAFVGELNGKAGEFPLIASAKSQCRGETRGLIKVFEREGILVGSYIIGPRAGEIIVESSASYQNETRP